MIDFMIATGFNKQLLIALIGAVVFGGFSTVRWIKEKRELDKQTDARIAIFPLIWRKNFTNLSAEWMTVDRETIEDKLGLRPGIFFTPTQAEKQSGVRDDIDWAERLLWLSILIAWVVSNWWIVLLVVVMCVPVFFRQRAIVARRRLHRANTVHEYPLFADYFDKARELEAARRAAD